MKHHPARRTISATEFKSHCLALLDQVAKSKETLVITKRGKPVAKLTAADEPPRKSMIGSVLWEGDILSPIDVEWDVMK